MFTGIIEEVGRVYSISKQSGFCRLSICAGNILDDVSAGDSIAVNGICITAAACANGRFSGDVMNETLTRTNLAELTSGSRVNLERAMPATGRFGGHIVTGHIDGTGIIRKTKEDGHSTWYHIEAPGELLRYIVEKGSIAIDGMSLTVAHLLPGGFAVSLIPHTLKHTILSEKEVGSKVNLETDCIGKYIESLINTPAANSKITTSFLNKHGF